MQGCRWGVWGAGVWGARGVGVWGEGMKERGGREGERGRNGGRRERERERERGEMGNKDESKGATHSEKK